MLREAFLIATLLCCAAVAAAAQTIDAGDRITVRSAVLKEDRVVYVRVPRHATASARYPVLYLTDGEAQFAHTVATIEFLARNGRMPQLIVVGIANTDIPRSPRRTRSTCSVTTRSRQRTCARHSNTSSGT
jgi:enterochelin esterase-like enzyme